MGEALPGIAGALLDVVPVGVLVIDPGGAILRTNPALRDLTGDRPARHVEELGAAPLWSAWRDGTGRPQRCSLADGRLVEGTWHQLGSVHALIVTDLSEDARVRRRLRQHNRALAELVATKTELVSALLHEVRTPLAAATSMAQLLPAAETDPVAEAIGRNLARLTAVTDEIALVSGIENGTIELTFEPVEVTGLLTAVAERTPIGLPVPAVAGTATLDPVRMTDALTRLAAAVHAIGGGQFPVTLTAKETAGGWRFALPLPPDTAADQLFTGGNATALMLARAVVARHDGTVGIEDNALTVTLPAAGPTPG